MNKCWTSLDYISQLMSCNVGIPVWLLNKTRHSTCVCDFWEIELPCEFAASQRCAHKELHVFEQYESNKTNEEHGTCSISSFWARPAPGTLASYKPEHVGWYVSPASYVSWRSVS